MFEGFTLRHILPLLLATTTAFGGFMPLRDPEGAIRLFGLPRRIVISKTAHPVMILSSARISTIGIAIWMLYFRKPYEAIDIVLTSIGWIGVVDGYVCWKEGVPGKAVMRSTSSFLAALWGVFGMTAGK
jgi:hypothetical protein